MEDKHWVNVNKAFSKQASHFDEDDLVNPVLQDWRKRVYQHVSRYMKSNSKILELNSGTGIDAIHFAKQGHTVHATDLSDGMITKLKEKIAAGELGDEITQQKISFEDIGRVSGKFDYVFSNFGGLNCTDNLAKVTKNFPALLNKNGYVTWVIMPAVAPWEWLWSLKGKFKMAFRRFNKNGVIANLEGENFTTYYFGIDKIKEAFGTDFQFISSEGLGIFSPPPGSETFIKKFPLSLKFLNKVDKFFSRIFPFNRWGDHIIVTFQIRK